MAGRFDGRTHWQGRSLLQRTDRQAEGEGKFDLLTVGSLLPWLELRIRSEVIGGKAEAEFDDTSLRDRLIVEQSKSGVSAAELSQAFNLRRGAVERIIARLTATDEDERKAV